MKVNNFEPKKPKPNMWGEAISPKTKSMRNEARLAKAIGFDVTPGSGNQPWPGGKGDGKHPLFMFELKETQRASLSVSERAIAKLCREAANVGKDPVLVMSAYGLSDPLPKDWVAVPAEVFRYLLQRLEDNCG